ncbi:MAG: hypothetical protein GZ094_22670 [Mariniphaga sp.]|nr:hypothetical protein [Mariniphaga sp.]
MFRYTHYQFPLLFTANTEQPKNYPAFCGWELGHLELGNAFSLDAIFFDIISSGIQKSYKKGGNNTISWHFTSVLTGGSAWDVTSNKTVAAMLPGGEKNE